MKVEGWRVEQHTMTHLNPVIKNLQYYGTSALTWVSARLVLQIHYQTSKMRARELRGPGFFFQIIIFFIEIYLFYFNTFDHVFGPMNLMQDR